MKILSLFALILVVMWCTNTTPPLASDSILDDDFSDKKFLEVTENIIINDNPNKESDWIKKNTKNNISDPSLDFLNLPEWFGVQVYAKILNARSLEIIESNNAYITFIGNRQESSVYATVDVNKDHTVDEIVEIASWLNSPNWVAYKDWHLYVAEIDRIIVFKNILEHIKNTDYEVVFDELPDDADHWWKYIAFGPDERLYIPIWAPCNNCDAWLPYSALYALDIAIWEFSLVAEWIRNTVWFDWHPDTWELWFTDNGRDLMWDDIPPDELNILKNEWEHFWYPFCHGWDIQDTEFTSRDCEEFIKPFAKLWPHVAALGLVFSDTANTWDQWGNHIFIAERGSWNRTTPIWYRISAVDLSTGAYKVFIDWWLQWSKKLGRPVDITTFPDGSLLISDDTSWQLYRVFKN